MMFFMKQLLSHQIIFLCVAVLLSSSSRERSRAIQQKEVVITDVAGMGKDLAFDILDGKLRVRRTTLSPDESYVFMLDGMRFPNDSLKVRQRFEQLSLENRLVETNGTLLFDGNPVKLPDAIKARAVWQAILWEGWVIALVQTSLTDEAARLEPPFFATELIYFQATQRVVESVRYMTFQPPMGLRLFVIRAEP